MTEQRKLAAIMFTGSFGYTRLMSEDEKQGYINELRNRQSISIIPQFLNPGTGMETLIASLKA